MIMREIFKRRRKPNTSNRIRTINLLGDKIDKFLKGEIIIGHCRGHDTIISFCHIRGFLSKR